MRHRMITGTGLGNPEPEVLTNNWTGNKAYDKKLKSMLKEGLSLFFKDIGHVDFEVGEGFIIFGYEPAYQYEPFRMIGVHRDIATSFITKGIAWGSYGSQVVATQRLYKNYKYKSKFIRFIDKWHSLLV